MLCEPQTGNLINRANEIMANIPDDFKARYSYELILSEIEVNTSVCTTVEEAMEEIIFLRNNTKRLGESYWFYNWLTKNAVRWLTKNIIMIAKEIHYNVM